MLGTGEAVLDPRGTLLQAVITHTDITDSVVQRERAQDAAAATARARTLLLRRVSEVLAADPRSLQELAHSITDIAATAVGDGAVLRVLTADRRAVEMDLVSHPDETTKARTITLLRASVDGVDAGRGPHGQVIPAGELLSSIGNAGWREKLHRRLGHQAIPPDAEHVVLAPVRHRCDAGFPVRLPVRPGTTLRDRRR